MSTPLTPDYRATIRNRTPYCGDSRISLNLAKQALDDLESAERKLAEKQQDWDRERQDFAKIADMLWRAEGHLKAERELLAEAGAIIDKYIEHFGDPGKGTLFGARAFMMRYHAARAVKDSLTTQETPDG